VGITSLLYARRQIPRISDNSRSGYDSGLTPSSSRPGSPGSKTTSFSPAQAPAATAAASHTITSLIGRSDKVEVLRAIEGLPPQFLTGATVTAAWDRLAQRTVSSGPRAPHLPPLHTDRAFLLLLERTRELLLDLSPGHCASIVGNLAKLRYRPDDSFLTTLLSSCRAREERQTFGQAARLASGLARLDYILENDELERLARIMDERMKVMDLDSLHPESLSLGLWSLAVLGKLSEPGMEGLRDGLVKAAIVRLDAVHMEATAVGLGQGPVLSEGKAKNLVRICRQLRIALLFLPPPAATAAAFAGVPAASRCSLYSGSAGSSSSTTTTTTTLSSLPSSSLSSTELLRLRINQIWLDLGAWLDPVRPSRLQTDVETTLRSNGAFFTREWEDGVVTVDIALHPLPVPEGSEGEKKEGTVRQPVALEVDGPSHFFVNHPQRPTGDTKIKHQALRLSQQWSAIISLPHFEWPRARMGGKQKKPRQQQLACLRRKVAQTGLEPGDFLV